MHQVKMDKKKKKLSEYGTQLREKQKQKSILWSWRKTIQKIF